MAVIQPYTERATAQGNLSAQATGEDFGAQIARARVASAEADRTMYGAIANVGQGVMEVANAYHQQQVQQEVTSVYTDTATAQTQLLTALKQKIQTAEPGDRSFVESFGQTVDDTLSKLSGNYTTPAAQREFARMSATITRDFMGQAIAQQAKLVADGVKVDNARINASDTSALMSMPGMLDSILERRNAQIDNPEGIYGQLSRSDRELLKLETEREYRRAAMTGEIVANPEAFLGKVAPDILKKFSSAERTVADFSTSTPTVNNRVAGLAPTIKQNADKFGVDANILTAQLMQESGGNTKAVSTKGAAGVSQFMPGTAARYNVDVNDDNSSIRGQANYMADLLKQFGGDYAKALAGYNWGEGNVQKAIDKLGVNWMSAAPQETRNYVGSIMKNAGVQAITGQPPVYDMEPVKIGDKNFDALPWQDQYQLLQTAQQHVSANQVRAQHDVAERERQRKVAESNEMKGMLVKLEEGSLTPDMVLQSKVLDAPSTMTMLNAIRVKANKLDDTKPEVLAQVVDQITNPKATTKITDPQELWSYVGKGLSLTDIQRLQGVVNGKGTVDAELKKAFLNSALMRIAKPNPITGMQDPDGSAQYHAFYSELVKVMEEKQKEGVTIRKMFSSSEPDNKDYLGWMIDKYTRTSNERMEAMARGMVPPAAGKQSAPARQPGQTLDQYEANKGR